MVEATRNAGAGAASKSPNTAAPKTSSKGHEKNGSKKNTDRNGTPIVAFDDLTEHIDAIPGIAAPEGK